jgi:hypothetical protein
MPSRRCQAAHHVSKRLFAPRLLHGVLFLFLSLVSLLSLAGCGSLSFEEQQRRIREHTLQLRVLTAEAFLTTWGPPTYHYDGLVQFYPLHDGQLVPSFLVPTGEAPKNWDSTIVSGVGRFLAYADRGEVLGFLDNRLVYFAQVPSAHVHALGKAWASELKFRTRTETEFLQGR